MIKRLFCIFIFIGMLYANDKKADIESNFKLDMRHSIEFLIDSIIKINWEINFDKKQDLDSKLPLITQKKNDVLESIPLAIVSNNNELLFNPKDSATLYKQKEAMVSESSFLDNNLEKIENEIALQELKAEISFYTAILNLRKKIDFFSLNSKVIEIIDPHANELKKLPNTFNIPQGLSKNELDSINLTIKQYLNKVATFMEILSYLELNPSGLLPQHTIFNVTTQWALDMIDDIIPISYSNIIIAKIIMSIVIFFILWGFRKLIAKLIMYAMDFIIHISNQDKALHAGIQKDILKPISLGLLAWSIKVSIGILYYPSIEPDSMSNWFLIFYTINIAWLFIVIIKSYGAVLISTIAQKSSDGFRREIINLIVNVLYAFVCIVATLAVLKQLGFNISAIVASLGLGGLAVALAVKDMLANFFASVMLLFDNSFSQGDWISVNGVEGSVVEIGLRQTKIRTFDNAMVLVPNSDIANKAVKNWNRRVAGRRIKMVVGVTYDATPTKLKECVEKITLMLKNHEGVATSENACASIDEIDHKISVRKDIISLNDFLGYKNGLYVSVDELADSSINIIVDCFSKSVSKADFIRVKEEIIYNIMDIVAECGLSFAFPSQSVYVENFPPISK